MWIGKEERNNKEIKIQREREEWREELWEGGVRDKEGERKWENGQRMTTRVEKGESNNQGERTRRMEEIDMKTWRKAVKGERYEGIERRQREY